MDISGKARKVLQILVENGHEAHLVGGCVRDGLLGRPVHDWDVTTSARPEQVMEIFPKTVPTGLAHGTVTVILEGQHFEVTTYRADGNYLDSRHPEAVEFVTDLAGDLARRDFTINAMAMDLDGRLTDLYGGQDDLRAGLLRCVGDPAQRFQEDALRMLRCVRFSAQLGFEVETATWQAVEKLGHLCENLSVERVQAELARTLLSARPQLVGQMMDLYLLSPWIPPQAVCLDSLADLPCEPLVRWAGLAQKLPDLDLKTLRLDKKTVDIATKSARIPTPNTLLEFKRLVADQGWNVGDTVAKLWGKGDWVATIQASGHCVQLGDLAVSGRDFPQLQGRAVGQMLQKLLTHVLAHPEDNRRERLLDLQHKCCVHDAKPL